MLRRIAYLCLILPLLGACAQAIGPEATTDKMRGDTSMTYVFKNDVQLLPRTRISGAVLQEGQHYRARGLLEIDGDVPPHGSLTVTDGKLVVTGNVARNSRITVMQDVDTFEEFRNVPCNAPLETTVCHEKVEVVRRKFSDGDPAVDIRGALGTDAKIITNGAVYVSGRRFEHPGYVATLP
ncbi:MAG: hypothetical protein K0R10_518 [Alphaproteobacteria bacterium]|nr:hypothetical protein [Alphaproteobacteria bacterium]